MDSEPQSLGTTSLSRRHALAATGTLLAGGLSGCLGTGATLGGPGTDDDGVHVVASFFSFYDFARKVAADTPITVENLVPTGMHGHGWEPDASITRAIIEADAFLHVGEEFQPWADRAIETVQDDGADTHLVNVREGIDLVPLAESLDPDEEGVGDNRGLDPHFWLDPQRAKQSVDNIAAGLSTVAPDHESTFHENAEAYKSDVLERIDDDYLSLFEDAPRTVVQVAAHNAFQYVTDRYPVEVKPLVTNLAASGDVKPSDIRRAKEVIEAHDIRYIGAGVFESRRPAKQLIAETPVEAYFPVTPYAGAREEWVEQGWGYEEIAYNINMPTFAVSLGAAEPEAVGPSGWADEWRNFE